MISFFICLLLLIGGYFVYGKVVENTFAPDDRETPAVKINDGVDYVVMPQWKLFLVQLLNTGINSVRMRFADVLLMYAEAVNERFGPRDDAKEALKRVRRRAFEPSLWANKVESYVESLNSEEEFFRAIMNERKWEFGGESIRKYDLARWNKYNEVIYNLYYEMINWVSSGKYHFIGPTKAKISLVWLLTSGR